jgi:hypothetical protein
VTAAAPPPDLASEQAAPWRVRAARRRVQPGVLRTAASFSQPLGSHIEAKAVRGYYIDLRAKTENLRWPPEWWCRHEEQEYIAVSQFGLACYERFVAGEGDDWLTLARRTGEYLIDQQHRHGVSDGGWVHLWAYPHTYALRPGWLSAMAQGEGASLLVRLFLTTGDPRFANAARRALRPLSVPASEGGVRASLDGGVFFEELPTRPSSLILNGGMFALWGCYDVAVGLGDGEAGELFAAGVDTLERNIWRWDTGFWSRYDLYPHPCVNVANPFYHRLHVSQLEAMQLLAPRRAFDSAIARFERYERSPVDTARAYGAKVAFRIVCPRSARLARGLPWADHPLVCKKHACQGDPMTSSTIAPGKSLLRIDAAAFAENFAKRPFSVGHSLVEHPLLTLEAIAALADEMPSAAVERHQANLPVFMPGGAAEIVGSPSDTVRGIESNDSWMVLWNIEQVPRYKLLLDTCLDEVERYVAGAHGGMRDRKAYLFLSAPNATTPVHFDPEHNLLLQIKGIKDMNVGRFDDPADQQSELDRYHSGGHRNLDRMPEQFTLFRMRPGDGVYVWPFAPHWVKNGSEASISLSITFRTRDSWRAERVHRFNARLRRLHLSPRPAGQSRLADEAKAKVMELAGRMRRTGSAGGRLGG